MAQPKTAPQNAALHLIVRGYFMPPSVLGDGNVGDHSPARTPVGKTYNTKGGNAFALPP